MSTTPLDTITSRAEALARRRERLAEIVGALNKGIEALKTDAMPELRQAITEATEAWSTLEAEIQANPELFVKPRTVTAHGIKFGLAKSKGTLEITDPEKTVKLIKRHFPEQAELLINTKEVPAKEAIEQLPAADLKRIGCEIKNVGDVVVIKPADGAIDKLVKALVKASVEDSAEVAP